jgi:hypothetical protein
MAQIIDNPPFDKCLFGVPNPDISLAREVILPFDTLHCVMLSSHLLLLDERRGKRI